MYLVKDLKMRSALHLVRVLKPMTGPYKGKEREIRGTEGSRSEKPGEDRQWQGLGDAAADQQAPRISGKRWKPEELGKDPPPEPSEGHSPADTMSSDLQPPERGECISVSTAHGHLLQRLQGALAAASRKAASGVCGIRCGENQAGDFLEEEG